MTMERRDGTPAAEKAWAWWTGVRQSLPQLRKAHGLSQRSLAALLGTTQGNIAQSELGRHETVRMPRLIPWLRALHVELVLSGPEEAVLVDDWNAETAQSVGRIVRNVREARGLSQDRLAELADCSTSTVQDLERQGTAVRVTTLASIFIALGWAPEIRFRTRRTRNARGRAGTTEGELKA